MATNSSTAKQTKKNKNKSSKIAIQELSTKVQFTPFNELKAKTREKVLSIRSLTIVMLPSIASKHDFQERQFVKITSCEHILFAQLILDSKISQDCCIISESNMHDLPIKENDTMNISSCPRVIAEEISLNLISDKNIGDTQAFIQYLKQKLIETNFVVQPGGHLIIQYLCSDIVLKIQSVKSFSSDLINWASPCECIWQTQVLFDSHNVSATDQNSRYVENFDSIGGYTSEIHSLQQEVVRFFEKENAGVKIIKGILISGSSGCGKSLIGKALINEYENKVINVDLELTKSRVPGEAEMNLKQLFAKAKKRSPCLVFIDDLDILCTSRDRGDNSSVVTTLLHLLDGLSTTSDEILVIATATKPQTLDAALRRPGRLSYDIILSPPEIADREAILEKMLSRVTNEISKEDLKEVTSSTPGYVGGDLHNLMLEAVMHSEGRALTKTDLDYASTMVKPVALKYAGIIDHKVTFSDIYGYDAIKSQLLESLNLSLNHAYVFEHCGLSTPTQFLYFGPPGCGKSSLIMALAAEFHLNIIRIKRSTVLGKYFGESEQNLARLFTQAQESSPCIIHFENFEGLAGRSRGDDGGSNVEGRIINHLKVQLDGIVCNEGVFIFAETNRPDLLDKDVIRPGRFHEYCYINLPEVEDRFSIMKEHLSCVSFSDNCSLQSLVKDTEGFSVAEILQLCNELKQQLETDEGHKPISKDIVDETLELLSPSTSKKSLLKYTKFASIYCSPETKCSKPF